MESTPVKKTPGSEDVGHFVHNQTAGSDEGKKEISGISFSGDVSFAKVADNFRKDTYNSDSPEPILKKVTKDDFLIAEKEYEQELAKYNETTDAIKELSKFFKDVADVNHQCNESLTLAINNQFKQVKSIGAGVPIEFANDSGNDKSQLQVVKQISDSKKYGPST